ncbi:MAG: bifunctional diaminohydroxyphosphoribosylaminopyrimidine deaminase/5-amino-6-(5-phosphoribosylamino)uracil reductase RibD [Bacillota bacterium]
MSLAEPLEAPCRCTASPWPQAQLSADDRRWVARAIALARRGAGLTSPNPAVGAVLVRGGQVVGEGYHRRAGGPHAEVVALGRAREAARGATLYVTLEPCSHWGRTPPCADALIAAGVRRVVACTVDPNPRVNGRGFERLARAGVKVELAGQSACGRVRRLNASYEKYITTGLPYVTIKVAMSLDGKIATASGDARWISSETSRALVHRLRARHDAVMVGVGTVLADDPLLTARPHASRPLRRQPLRVVVDGLARTPADAQLIRTAAPGTPVLVAVTARAPAERVHAIRSAGAEVAVLPAAPDGRVDLPALMEYLAGREVTSILVEGGGTLVASLIEAGLPDRLVAFVAPKILGGRSAPSPVEGSGAASVTAAWALGEWRVRRVPGSGSPPDLVIEALFPAAAERLRCAPAQERGQAACSLAS